MFGNWDDQQNVVSPLKSIHLSIYTEWQQHDSPFPPDTTKLIFLNEDSFAHNNWNTPHFPCVFEKFPFALQEISTTLFFLRDIQRYICMYVCI